MKQMIVLYVLAVFVAGAGPAVAEQSQGLDASITHVTVFTRQAMVTRAATADVGQGIYRLSVPTEAISLVEDSVTAAVFGDGEVLGVQVVRVPVSEKPQPAIREIEAQLEELEYKKRALNDAVKSLSKQEAFLDGLIDLSADRHPEAGTQALLPTPEILNTYLLFFDETYTAVFDKQRKLHVLIAAIDRDIERLRRELDLIRRTDQRERISIEVLFNSSKAQTAEIEARYRVDQARWSPVYRASVDSSMTGVDLVMMADITQTTGEDWKDVSLTVSNAVPVVAGHLPVLPPWRLAYTQVLAEREKVSRMHSMDMAETLAAARPAEPQRRETALAFEYTMPAPVTIASRQQSSQVPVVTRTITGDFYHYSVPSLTSDVYLVCDAQPDRELLPGPVNVFFENRYTGRMILDEKSPGERFTLALGIDRAVRIKREKVRDHITETAFFGRVERDTVIRQISYRITAENLKDRPVQVHVRDHVPVSATDRITVKDIQFSPEPDMRDVDAQAGVMQWHLEMGPGAQSDITIDFTVTYPRDMPRPAL